MEESRWPSDTIQGFHGAPGKINCPPLFYTVPVQEVYRCGARVVSLKEKDSFSVVNAESIYDNFVDQQIVLKLRAHCFLVPYYIFSA